MVFAGGAQGQDVGVVVAYLGAFGLGQFHQLVGGGFSVVVHVFLVGRPQQQDFGALE